MTKDQDDRFIAALERGMPKAEAIEAIYEQYPMTVSLGVLTATRPIGARVEFFVGAIKYEGILTNLTPSEHAKLYYVVHLRTEDGQLIRRLELSHPITLVTDRHGRPEDGHTFRIEMTSRQASSIMGPDDPEPHSYADAPEFTGEPWHVEVRAHSLKEALERAAEISLQDWRLPDGTSLWQAR